MLTILLPFLMCFFQDFECLNIDFENSEGKPLTYKYSIIDSTLSSKYEMELRVNMDILYRSFIEKNYPYLESKLFVNKTVVIHLQNKSGLISKSLVFDFGNCRLFRISYNKSKAIICSIYNFYDPEVFNDLRNIKIVNESPKNMGIVTYDGLYDMYIVEYYDGKNLYMNWVDTTYGKSGKIAISIKYLFDSF